MTRRPTSPWLVLPLLAFGLAACSSNTTVVPPAGPSDPDPTPGDPVPAPPATGSSSGATSSGGTAPPPDAPLPATWGAQACPAASGAKGFAVGESLGDLELKDCDTGAPAKLDELCGASATWIFAAHTHCPTCQATAGFTDDVAAAVASKNVAIAHIVYNDNGTSCAKWKAAYKLAGVANVRVYEDPTGDAWAKLKTSNFTAPSAFLDANRVITFKEHGLAKSAVLTQIDAALAKK
ncbi:MAG: redoxin family protein [Myxococcales bacterium]|nr:redoxin family protein [Myxococcales bacterium]